MEIQCSRLQEFYSMHHGTPFLYKLRKNKYEVYAWKINYDIMKLFYNNTCVIKTISWLRFIAETKSYPVRCKAMEPCICQLYNSILLLANRSISLRLCLDYGHEPIRTKCKRIELNWTTLLLGLTWDITTR